MGRSPSKSGDTVLDLHTEAIMELSDALNDIQPIIASRKQNPETLARALVRMIEAAEHAVANIQAAEAIRKAESPRRISALEREAKKRKPQ